MKNAENVDSKDEMGVDDEFELILVEPFWHDPFGGFHTFFKSMPKKHDFYNPKYGSRRVLKNVKLRNSKKCNKIST